MSMDISLIKRGNDAELRLDGYIDASNAADVTSANTRNVDKNALILPSV